MKTYLDCIPCFLKQSLEAARMAIEDETVHAQVLAEVMKYLQNASFAGSPPELSRNVHNIIREVTKSNDPYGEVKNQSNEAAKKLYLQLREHIINADDPLLLAVKFAMVGNVMDFGAIHRFDVNKAIDDIDEIEYTVDAYPRFKKTLAEAKTVLYIADNTGELYFDKLLLEILAKQNRRITYVVRANPIINDITIKDAKKAGIDSFAKIIAGDAGQHISAPGMLLKYASSKFLKHLKSADMIIAKGQGNYEALSDSKHEIFFLLVVKCPLVAHDIGTKVGSMVLKVMQ